MYDYVDGKVDWMAYGLPTEGEDGPFVGGQVTPVATCEAAATVAEARSALADAGPDGAIVVHDGLAVGEIDDEALDGCADDQPVLEVLRPVPSTVRPSATVSSLREPDPKRVVVTTSDGRLLGRAVVDPGGDTGTHDDHLERMERELSATMHAVAEHFGDREPSDEELRTFLRDRLVSEGRSPEEADRFMAELGDDD